jgi:hypothetical protein
MTPFTCAIVMRFLPQIDVQQIAALQAVPPIDTTSGITPSENFQDGIYMRNKGTTSQSHHVRFRRTLQASYDKACHLNQIQHAHQGVDCKKAIRKDQGFGTTCGQPFLAAQTTIISFRELLRVMMVKTPCFKMSPMGAGYQGCFAHQHNSTLTW